MLLKLGRFIVDTHVHSQRHAAGKAMAGSNDYRDLSKAMYGIEAYDASDLWSDGSGGTTNKLLVGGVDQTLRLLKVKNYPKGDTSKHFDIGEIIEDNPGEVWVLDDNGRRFSLESSGWKHF